MHASEFVASKMTGCLGLQIDPDFLSHFFAVKCKMEDDKEAIAKAPLP